MLFKGKRKIQSRTGHEVPEGKQRYSSTLSLTSALDAAVFSDMPRPLCQRERPSILFIGLWVGPRASHDGYGRFNPPPGFDPRTVQPVASRYTSPQIVLFIVLKFKIVMKQKHDGVLIETRKSM